MKEQQEIERNVVLTLRELEGAFQIFRKTLDNIVIQLCSNGNRWTKMVTEGYFRELDKRLQAVRAQVQRKQDSIQKERVDD